MVRDSDSVRLARIDEKVINMEAWAKKHETHDDDRFNKTFSFTKDQFDKQNVVLDKINNKLDTLWDVNNQQKGIFSASRMIMGAFWAIIVITIDWMISGIHGR